MCSRRFEAVQPRPYLVGFDVCVDACERFDGLLEGLPGIVDVAGALVGEAEVRLCLTYTVTVAYLGEGFAPGDVRFETRADPTIQSPADAIIRLSATCVCGSDLWATAASTRSPSRRRWSTSTSGLSRRSAAMSGMSSLAGHPPGLTAWHKVTPLGIDQPPPWPGVDPRIVRLERSRRASVSALR